MTGAIFLTTWLLDRLQAAGVLRPDRGESQRELMAGRRDDRRNQTRTFSGATATKPPGATCPSGEPRAVGLGAFCRRWSAAVATSAGAVFGLRSTADIGWFEKALGCEATRAPIAKVLYCETVARSGSGCAALPSPKLGSSSICFSQSALPGFSRTPISRALFVRIWSRLLICRRRPAP
jgi:hypothetical protein